MGTDPDPLAVEHVAGEVAQLLGPWPDPRHMLARRIRVATVQGPAALVLGSTQGRARAASAPAPRGTLAQSSGALAPSSGAPGASGGPAPGLLRRRGGGGAVLVAPGAQLWIDLWLPRTDVRWEDDVITGVRWIGEAWARALGEAGLDGLDVHRGPSRGGLLAASVCFAGVGPGEVVVGDPVRKVMGLSQHRSRPGARIQMLAVRHWDPDTIVHHLCRAGLLDLVHAARYVEAARPRAAGLAELGMWPPHCDQPEWLDAVVAQLAAG